MAVFSNDESIDAVGACIGFKGARVNSIVEELQDEKIDIIDYDKDIKKFISNALSPADIIDVLINEKTKKSLVVVSEDQLSLAIGKEGQNARLAARLTGWKIDIKSEEVYESLDQDEIDEILGLNDKDLSEEVYIESDPEDIDEIDEEVSDILEMETDNTISDLEVDEKMSQDIYDEDDDIEDVE